jgi:geranylgeranyl pyrophosphate synthase
MLLEITRPEQRHLRRMLLDTIAGQSSTEYPFILTYSFCKTPRDGSRVKNIAAAVHLLQSSTLISDDIFDCADARYYRQSMPRKYGVSYTVMATELMQSIALEQISAELERGGFSHPAHVMTLLQRIVKDLYLGQYLDVYYTGKTTISIEDYYALIGLGAGRFLAHVAECGALLAGKSSAEVRHLGNFGYNYGMALFISDDIIDVLQRPSETGKNFATDLKQQRMRLPMILALRAGTPPQRRRLREFLRIAKPSAAQVRTAVATIRETGAPEKCNAIAQRFLSNSFRAIDKVKTIVSREHLRWLSESLLRAQGLED